MEHVNVTLRRSTATAAAVLLVPALAACGFDRPTDRVYNPGVGVNDRSGSVDVLHALVVSGADGSGTVTAGLANNDVEEADALTGITGADGSGVTVELEGEIEVPRGGSVQLLDENAIPVEGEEIAAGNFVTLVFTFERGATVTVEVPVVARRGDYADVPVPSVAPTTAAPEEETGDH